jgi:AAA domain
VSVRKTDVGCDLGAWLDDVTPEKIDWLWPGYVALGMLTVLDGDPGLGKSTLALDLAARVSTGRPMPDRSPGVRGGVLILSAEDHLAKVIRPRLDAIDADLSLILALEVVPASDGGERDVEIPADLDYIEQAIEQSVAVLVIVDPLVAFLGADVNSHRDQDIRRVLRRLKALAEKKGVAILVIRHLNKGIGGNPLYRGGGSIGIIGAARGGLLVAPDPDVEGGVVMACSKSSLGVKPPSQAFHIEGAPNGAGRVKWDGASAHTPATLLAAPQDGSHGGARQDGEEFLRETLARGPRPTGQVEDDAADLGIRTRTLARARAELGVVAYRESVPGEKRGAGQWLLRLPGSSPQTIKGANSASKENLAPLIDSEYESPESVPEVGSLDQGADEKPWNGSVEDYRAFPWGES